MEIHIYDQWDHNPELIFKNKPKVFNFESSVMVVGLFPKGDLLNILLSYVNERP